MTRDGRRPTAGGPDKSRGEIITIHRLPSLRSYAARANLRTYAFPRHFHDEYFVSLLISGNQASSAGRNTREIQRVGEVRFAEPGEIHDGTPVDQHARTYWTFYLEQDVFRGIVTDIGEFGLILDWPSRLIRDPGLARILATMFDAIASGAPVLDIETQLFHTVTRIGRTVRPPSSGNSRNPPAALLYAKQMIDDDPAAQFQLTDLASATGLTKYQIVHGFQRLIGLAPHTYQIQRRISLATKLIQTGRPLAESASEAGFSDQAHMTRTFRTVLGVAPSAFAPHRFGRATHCVQT